MTLMFWNLANASIEFQLSKPDALPTLSVNRGSGDSFLIS